MFDAGIFFRTLFVQNRWCHVLKREFSDQKKYTDTINLPKTKFASRLKPDERTKVERQINEVWM